LPPIFFASKPQGTLHFICAADERRIFLRQSLQKCRAVLRADAGMMEF
jgi:hypothetical protein